LTVVSELAEITGRAHKFNSTDCNGITIQKI
jgi:hypothetical protein